MADCMVMVAVAVVPVKLPVPFPAQDSKMWPELGVAVMVTFMPALYHPLLGVTVPGPLTSMVR